VRNHSLGPPSSHRSGDSPAVRNGPPVGELYSEPAVRHFSIEPPAALERGESFAFRSRPCSGEVYYESAMGSHSNGPQPPLKVVTASQHATPQGIARYNLSPRRGITPLYPPSAFESGDVSQFAAPPPGMARYLLGPGRGITPLDRHPSSPQKWRQFRSSQPPSNG